MSVDHPSPSNPTLRYLNTVQRTATDFWNDQIVNWTRIWGRVQGDDYTFGKWVHDAVQTWDGSISGASRVASLPSRQFEDVLPTLTLLTDTNAKVGPKGQFAAPDDFQFGGSRTVESTQFSVKAFEDNFRIEATGNSSAKAVSVNIVPKQANGKFSAASRGLDGQSASAVIYQGGRPLAVVELAFKKR